jgi:hypothetical protein
MGSKNLLFLVSACLCCAAGRISAQGFDAGTFKTVPAAVPEPVAGAAAEVTQKEDPDDPATWVGSRRPLESDLAVRYAGPVNGTEHFQQLLTGYSILKATTAFDDWTYGTGKGQVVCTTFVKYTLLQYMTRLNYPQKQIDYVKGLSDGAPEMREQIQTGIRMAAGAARRLPALRALANPTAAQKKLIRNYEDITEKVPFIQVPVNKKELQPGDVLFFHTRHVVFYVQPHSDGVRLGIYHAAGVDYDVTYSGVPASFIMKAFRLKAKNGVAA